MSFKHQEIKILPYPREFLYNLVANVEGYPSFIPWISSIEVLNSSTDSNNNPVIDYQITVDFKVITETFSTRDVFSKPTSIDITLLKGPFKYLKNIWQFEEVDATTTKIIFDIEFEFKSRLFTAVFGKVFIQAQKRILSAFANQASKAFRG